MRRPQRCIAMFGALLAVSLVGRGLFRRRAGHGFGCGPRGRFGKGCRQDHTRETAEAPGEA